MFYIYYCTIRAVNQFCEVDRRFYDPARRLHINCKNLQLPDEKLKKYLVEIYNPEESEDESFPTGGSKKTVIDLSVSAKKRVKGNPKAVAVIPSIIVKPPNNKKAKIVKVVQEIPKTPKGNPVAPSIVVTSIDRGSILLTRELELKKREDAMLLNETAFKEQVQRHHNVEISKPTGTVRSVMPSVTSTLHDDYGNAPIQLQSAFASSTATFSASKEGQLMLMLFAAELGRKANHNSQDSERRFIQNFQDSERRSNATLLQTMAFISNPNS